MSRPFQQVRHSTERGYDLLAGCMESCAALGSATQQTLLTLTSATLKPQSLQRWCTQPGLATHEVYAQGRPALVVGDTVYLRVADIAASETAAAMVSMRGTQALLAVPPAFFGRFEVRLGATLSC